MELRWSVLMILASGSFTHSSLTSHNISLLCEDFEGFPKRAAVKEVAPKPLSALNASLSVEDGRNVIDISWAIDIDSSIKYIDGINIIISPEQQKCKYNPSLAEAMNRSLISVKQKQIWFHHRIRVFSDVDSYYVRACTLPLPPRGFPGKSAVVMVPTTPDPTTSQNVSTHYIMTTVTDEGGHFPLLVPVGGGLIIGLVLLLCGYVTYKKVSASLAGGFQKVAAGPKVPVLVVYPVESVAFHGAVVALAEFLQQHGGCSVGIDMWQQGSVAKLGPMRWLQEQVQTAHRVIIVAPQPSPQPSSQTLLFPGVSMPPAAAQDLYPLALNLVASRAKNCTELAKFWIVCFGESRPLTYELQACRKFCLMKDLNKLCRRLQSQRKDGKNTKLADLLTRHADWSGRRCTEKLSAAVQALHGSQVNVVTDQDCDKRSKLIM